MIDGWEFFSPSSIQRVDWRHRSWKEKKNMKLLRFRLLLFLCLRRVVVAWISIYHKKCANLLIYSHLSEWRAFDWRKVGDWKFASTNHRLLPLGGFKANHSFRLWFVKRLSSAPLIEYFCAAWKIIINIDLGMLLRSKLRCTYLACALQRLKFHNCIIAFLIWGFGADFERETERHFD